MCGSAVDWSRADVSGERNGFISAGCEAMDGATSFEQTRSPHEQGIRGAGGVGRISRYFGSRSRNTVDHKKPAIVGILTDLSSKFVSDCNAKADIYMG